MTRARLGDQGWRSDHESHDPLRRVVLGEIFHRLVLYRSRNRLVSENSTAVANQDRMIRIARCLEYRIYVQATSLEEYSDLTTLNARLRQAVSDLFLEHGLNVLG